MFIHSVISASDSMVSSWIFALLIIVAALHLSHGVLSELDKSQAEQLFQFMSLRTNVSSINLSLEKNVQLLRRFFITRLRCGTEQSIHRKTCEDVSSKVFCHFINLDLKFFQIYLLKFSVNYVKRL